MPQPRQGPPLCEIPLFEIWLQLSLSISQVLRPQSVLGSDCVWMGGWAMNADIKRLGFYSLVLSLRSNSSAAGGFFGHYKMMQKPGEITESLPHGYSSESTQ